MDPKQLVWSTEQTDRTTFAGTVVAVLVVLNIANLASAPTAVMWLTTLFGIWIMANASVGRLRDLEMSPIWALPLLGFQAGCSAMIEGAAPMGWTRTAAIIMIILSYVILAALPGARSRAQQAS